MVQILNKNPKSFGEAFGESLQKYGENKLKHIEARNVHQNASQRLQALGLGPAEADYLATLPPKEQSALLQSYSQGAQPQQQQQLPYDPNDQRAMAQYHLDRALKQQQGQEIEPMGTGIGAQAATPEQGAQQAPTFLQAIGRRGTGGGGTGEFDRKEQRAEEKHQMEKEKFNLAEYEKLEPFLKGQAEDYKNAKNISVVARRMRDNILKHKDKWPGVSGYLPSGFFRDNDIRKYIADANKLVLLSAGSRKGQPTNFKIKLEQLTKPELNQPIQTQLDLLNDYINDADEVFGNQKNIERIRQENEGKYPRDLAQRLIEQQLSNIGGEGQGPQAPQGPQSNTQQGETPQQQMNQEQQTESPEQSWLGDIVDTLGGVGAETARATAAPLASLGSFAAGLPAIPGQLALGALGYLTGGKTPSYEDLQKYSPIPLPKTGAQIREKIDEATSGLTKSQGEAEQLREDILADTALALMLPAYGVGKAATTGLKVAGALFRSTGGNLSALAAEKLGAGPVGQTGAKILGMAAASTAGGRRILRKQMQANYDAATKAQGSDRAMAKPLAQNISKMASEVEKSDIPGKAFIQDRLQAVNNAIVNDRIPVADARQLKVDMGKWRNSRETPREAQPYIKRIGADLKNTLDDYGKTNPDFGKNFKAAEDLFAGLGSELKLAQFTKQLMTNDPEAWKKIGSNVTKTLLTAGLIGGSSAWKGLAGATGATAGVLGSRELYKVYRLLANSPQARQYYKEAAQAALRDDKVAFIKSATKLDQIAKKEDSKEG